MSVFIFTSSRLLVSRQVKRNNKSRTKDPSEPNDVANSNTVNKYNNLDTNAIRSHIEVTFKDLQYQVTVPKRDRKRSNLGATRDILPRISGTVPAGKLSVILGPTACGKSTLLNMIRTGGQDASSGSVSVRLISGDAGGDSTSSRVLTRGELSQFIGHVPQEDILDRDLTIRELLTFNTLARLSHVQTVSQSEPIVNSVLSDLAIQHVADSVIGGGENKSPPAGEVDSYLESIGYVKPSKNTATADFCIDVLNGLAERRSDSSGALEAVSQLGSGEIEAANGSVSSGSSSKKRLGHRQNRAGSVNSEFNLLAAWQSHCIAQNSPKSGASGRVLSKVSTVGQPTPSVEQQITLLGQLHRDFSHFTRLSVLNAQRLLTIRLRNTFSLLTYFAINCIMAIALSSGFSILLRDSYLKVLSPPTKLNLQGFFPSPLSDYSSWNEESFNFTQLLFFMAGALGCASCLTAVPVFSGQLALIKRERAAGMSVVAYTFGRMMADLLFVVFNGMVYTGTWMVFGHAGHWYHWIASIVCTAFAASGIGYITGTAFRAGDASVYAIMLTFIFCVFSGTEPTLADVTKYPIVNWPWYLSFATYTSEATYYTWTKYLDNNGHVDDPVQEGADYYGYTVDQGLGRSIGALIALGVAMRVIAGLILYFKSKGK
eukprot:gene27766-34534_t